MTAEASSLMGKRALAQALGWARTRLDRRLRSDATFPVVARGDQAGGWAFDLKAVKAHLDGHAEGDIGGDSAEGEPVAPAGGRRQRVRSADHRGEATARQRLDNAAAALAERKLAKSRASLVERDDLHAALGAVVTVLDNALATLPGRIVDHCALPADAAPIIGRMIEKIRANLKLNARAALDPTSRTPQ